MNITEIARISKVSRSTVSRVLNNNPLVKEETRAAVQKVIDEMNYTPSFAARTLANKRNNVIGALIYNIVQPFWAGIFSGIERYVSSTDYGILLVNSKNHLDVWDYRKDYKKNLKSLVQRGVDGIIIALNHDLDLEDIDFLESSGTPFVVIQDSTRNARIASVNVDNVAGAAEATRHLLKLGHRQIFHAVGPLDSTISKDRMQGYLNAMQEANLPVTNNMLVGCNGFLFYDGYWYMKRLLAQKQRPTAVLFTNDITAFGGYQAARENGLSMPEDLSVIGFDHLASSMDVAGLLPDLTTMIQPVGKIGYEAAKMLLRHLDEGQRSASVVLSMILHEGDTAAEPLGNTVRPGGRGSKAGESAAQAQRRPKANRDRKPELAE